MTPLDGSEGRLGGLAAACLVRPGSSMLELPGLARRPSVRIFMKRFHVNKRRSAGKFKQHLRHTKSPNVAQAPMRGGWRL